MPKQKTHRGAAKRFKVTKSGKVLRSQAYKRHILTKKPTKRTRRLSSDVVLSKADQKTARKLLGL